ncbi:hypothetical protein [Xanthomonas sacchari]|uniref:hypothetical protein n=1 Tax=Xanthomonas sacchari TaxID=56458 RepID=UPI00225AF843|nr:hypothetical protein [Xanthomonas sacchari]
MSVVEVLSRDREIFLLSHFDLRIGDWEQIEEKSTAKERFFYSHEPSRDYFERCSYVKKVASWLLGSGWVIIRLDNSTFPLDDEAAIFKSIIRLDEDVDIHCDRSFLVGSSFFLAPQIQMVLLLSANAGWHIHLVSEGRGLGRRLSVLDGVFCFYGCQADVSIASELN